MNKFNKILITGASGFIGARIAEIMYLTKSYQVRAGIRNWASCARIGRFPMEIVNADIMNPYQINKALQGISAIVHCAKGQGEVTVKGTKNLLEAAINNNIKHFIHLSTTEVYGNVSGTIDENYTPIYTGNPYGDSKIAAEDICNEYSNKGLPITILRPPIVYGPFSKNWTLRIGRNLLTHKIKLIKGFGEGYCNLIYVDDVYRAVVSCLKNEDSIGKIYNINGPEIITWNEYFQKFNDSLGLPPLQSISATESKRNALIMQPIKVLGTFVKNNYMESVKKLTSKSKTAKLLIKKLESRIKSTPDLEDLNLYNRRAKYNANFILETIKFKPKFYLYDGLDVTVKWLLHHSQL